MTINITASQLHPGDIVLTPTGERWFAAFDVDHTRGGTVRTWTAQRDQDNGQPDTRDFAPATGLTVQRRDGGPAVTHTSL